MGWKQKEVYISMKISLAAEMREMDRVAIERYAIDELILMENAGAAAFRVLVNSLDRPLNRVQGVILCGGGNNGGDGFVVARHIHSAGGAVVVILCADPGKFGGAAATNLRALEKLNIPLLAAYDPADVQGAEELVAEWVAQADYLVDGLLGTGISRPVEGMLARVIERVNQSGKPVLSLDIPSGVNGDTGAVMGTAVKADWTIAFGLPKPGNLLYPGHGRGGKLFVSHIAFPPALYESDNLSLATNGPIPLPPRDPDGHKSSFGQALIVAGAASYYGAPFFSAMAFLRSGGGYARLATPASLSPHLAVGGREIVFLPQSETESGSIQATAGPELVTVGNRMDCVVVGPGLSTAPDAQKLTLQLVDEIETPLLIDGDGLTAVAEQPTRLAARPGPTLLTPHLGEMARLTGRSVGEIRENRIEILQSACAEWQSTVVLKGAHSLIGLPDGRVYVNLSGNSGMGTAGSGDVLAGCIAGLVGMGLDVTDAARMGVFIHGVAGDLAAAAQGQDGMTAQDILDALPQAMRAARRADVGQAYALPVIW